jgi:hypothetical protein
MRVPAVRLALIAAGFCALILACSPIGGTPQPGDQTAPASPPEGNGTSATQADRWLEATLALRSVHLELATVYSEAEAQRVSAQIDAAGNVHLSFPAPLPEGYAATPGAVLPGDFELFIVGGQAFTRIGTDSPVRPDDTFLTMLADTLCGPEGPGLWLNLLTEDSFGSAVAETYGGFAATRYAVDGQVADGSLTGTIWIDEQASALVGAELTVSESLFYPPDSGLSGDVEISLQVEQADVPPITLP